MGCLITRCDKVHHFKNNTCTNTFCLRPGRRNSPPPGSLPIFLFSVPPLFSLARCGMYQACAPALKAPTPNVKPCGRFDVPLLAPLAFLLAPLPSHVALTEPIHFMCIHTQYMYKIEIINNGNVSTLVSGVLVGVSNLRGRGGGRGTRYPWRRGYVFTCCSSSSPSRDGAPLPLLVETPPTCGRSSRCFHILHTW